jgi:MoaA/NifB/PqqE/SkfB family radical SAM enzyme/glycosyltransferase involved in cell wall biosynthesis
VTALRDLPSDSPLVDAFLRGGFAGTPGAGDLAPRLRAAFGVEARSYPLGASFAALLPEVRRGRAPFVLFADQGIDAGEGPLRRLGHLLRHHPGIPALTLGGEALGRVYGEAPAPPRGGRLAQRLLPARHLPSWLCAVNRQLLGEEETGGFETLEFFLLDLGRRLAERGGRPLLAGSAAAALDTRRWARDLLFRAAGPLAADYRRYRDRHGEAGVPPQLRVEVQGERVAHPGRLDPAALAGPPRISILCPVFKSEFLAETVGSVLQQSWPDWELLIRIDGPPEAEERKILEILAGAGADSRIQVHRGPNLGTGPSRQALAAAASGDFLLSLDDDDLLPAHALEVLASAVRRHPDVQCFRGGTRLVGLVDELLPPRPRLVIDGISGDPFEVSQPFLVARETLAALGGFEGDPAIRNAGEDTYLFHQLDRARVRTLIVDEPLYYRRLSHGNLSLLFEAGEVVDHFRNLERRFCPPGWRAVERRNELDGGFQQSIVTYHHDAGGPEVVTATRFFQYQTLGSESLAAIDLEITSVCNAVCSFCPRDEMPDKSSFMRLEVVEALAGQLAREARPRQVILCGIGESTLHPRLPAIVRALSQAGARVCMTTNGARLDGERFRGLIDEGLQEVNFSLNAATAETHLRVMRLRGFDRVRRNLAEVLELKRRRFPHVKVHVSFVLCNQNQHEVERFVEEWRGEPVSQIWIHPINNRAGLLAPGVEAVDLEPLARRYAADERVVVDLFKHHPEHGNVCRIAQGLDFISVGGEVRLCAMDYRRTTAYGNVGDGLLRHLHLEKILSYRRGETLELCRGCDFYPGPAAAGG